jgi:Flp pilus assembly protein TadG
MLAALTLVLPVLLGAMALGADFSIVYFNWALVQKAADAAALAGASQLTGVTGSASSGGQIQSNAVNYVNGYACLNGVTDPSHSNSTLCPSPATKSPGWVDNVVFTNVTDTRVSVGIHRSVPYFFGKMIGLQEASVAAKATAAVEGQGTVSSGMFPVGLQCTAPCSTLTLDPGQSVTFGAKFVGGLAPGNWDWLALGGNPGAKELGNAIQYGASGSYSISDLISTAPGNKGNAGPVKQGFDARMAACHSTTTATDPCQNGALVGGTNGIGGSSGLPASDSCLVTVPAVDFTTVNGRKNVPIEAFAEIYIERATSDSKTINGCFVQQIIPPTLGSASAPVLGPTTPPRLIN